MNLQLLKSNFLKLFFLFMFAIMEPDLKQWGGQRPKAGRKPAEDKKQAINVWLLSSVIARHGGPEALKEKIRKQYSK